MLEKIDNIKSIHFSQLVVLFDQYRVFYKKETDLEKVKEFLEERIENKDSMIYVALDQENVAVGFTQLYPLFSSTRMKKMWLLNDLFVNEDNRRKGYSKLLIEAAKKVCINTKASGVMLETAKNNTIANRLYRETGFVLEEDCNFYNWS